MNIKNITVIKSSLLTSLLLILIVVITGCITRDGEILGRNNPVDPFNKNRKVFSIDTLWNSFDKSASTGTLNCTIQVESSFFRLYVLQNDSLEAVYSGNTNSFLISNMRPATIRNYIFVAYTSQTDSLIDSGFIETPSGIPPEAPQNLTASGTISGITLYWTGTKQTGETVTIYRADSLNGNFIQKATTTDTIYIDSVKTYNPFIYMISARNRFGETRCTTVVSARRLINTPPPSGIMITENMTDSTITIRWKAVPGITSYIIFKSDKENGSYEELGKRNDTTITIKSIPGDTVYYKIAVIVQNDKCGLLSNAVMGYVSPRVTPPENVNASQGLYDNYIKISWNRVAGAQKYIIYRTTTQNGIPAIIDSTKDTTYTDTVNSASEYFYSISSQGSNGYRSQRSNTVTGFIKIIPAPIGLSASDGTDNRFINLSWNPYSGSSSFKIYKSKHPDSTFIPIGTSILPEYQDTVPDVFTWYFKVSSINHKGIESRLSDFDSGYRKGLNAPLNPRASQGEYPLYVYITWGTVSGASYYKIYRSTAPFTTFQLLAVSTSPSYIDSSSVSSSYYRISGVDSYGVEGGMSAAVIGYPGALGTTSRISASFDRPKSIVVTWDSVQNAEKYIVYRSSNISNFYPLDTVTSLSYTDSSVKSAYYKVAIIYKTRTGQLSSYAYGTVLFPPSSVQLSADSTKFNLSWTEITGATRYRIYRSTDNSVFSPLDTTNKHTYSDTKIKKGTFYYYKISSLSQYGESSQSQSIQGIVLAAPTGLKSSASHDTITVRWDTVPFATSYQLYFKSKSDSNYDSPYQTSNTTIKFIATETSVYSFQVRAANNVSISGFSKQDSCAVTARPLPPINFLAFSNPGFIKLSWRPDSSGGKPDSYIIYRSNTAYGTYTAIDTINDTTYSDTLRQPVDRYYKVSALNTSGVSSQTSWLRSSSLSISAPAVYQ
ncbi:MAG: hypothetical protein GX640_15810 [Fibrobacter sp.]|nr:hypothetical protein [Fibrobacter sp.]